MTPSPLLMPLLLVLLGPPAGSGSGPAPADANGSAAAATVSSLTAAEAASMVKELMPRVEEIRGLKFVRPVPVEIVGDAAARDHFKARMKKYWPEAQVRREQEAYIQLGLLPSGADLEATLFSVLEEQAGGYYDPGSHTFCVLGDMPRSFAPVLMVHELTHALDDQHFAIDGMIDKVAEDGDRSDVIGAVIEGSGTLVMTRYVYLEILAGRMSPDVLKQLADTDAGRAEKLLASPQVLQRGLLASYILGQTFILRGDLMGIAKDLPTADIDRLFHEPPASTEQLLHPQKYWDEAQRDQPRQVTLPNLSATLGNGWKLEGGGRLGELTLAVLTGAPPVDIKSVEAADPARWTNDAAAGWGGDRWQLYANGDRRVTVLATVWDTPKDAAEFDAAVSSSASGSARRHWMQGTAVVLVAGDAEEKAQSLAAAVLKALGA